MYYCNIYVVVLWFGCFVVLCGKRNDKYFVVVNEIFGTTDHRFFEFRGNGGKFCDIAPAINVRKQKYIYILPPFQYI